MTQSATDSAVSPAPFSPFSTYSVASGVTSDDTPDLGAFNTVFRALTNLQRTPQHNHGGATPLSLNFTPSDDSDPTHASTRWSTSQGRVPSHMSSSAPGSPLRRQYPPLLSESDATASERDSTELEVPIEDEAIPNQPSLGALDSALQYLAAERERLFAERSAGLKGNNSTTSDSAPRIICQLPRRKRRRTRSRQMRPDGEPAQEPPLDDGQADEEDVDDSSSDPVSSSPVYKTTPSTPARLKAEKNRRRKSPDPKAKPRLHHSKSTSALTNPLITAFDARMIALRTLAHKLRLLYPPESKALSALLSSNLISSPSTFADPRGPAPRAQDPLTHVFIDHSNILIGFIEFVKKHLSHLRRSVKPLHMSHAALALILERGRPISRRVLAASSPLYQPLATAEQIGYEVRIFIRVPDTGDGPDRQSHLSHNRTRSLNTVPHTHSHGHTPTNGDAGRPRGRKSTPKRNSMNGATNNNNSESDTGTPQNGGAAGRVRYREQGVDELLQLKLHQAIADVDQAPAGATIVLATGDGNVGQFNQDGFLGCVRTALKKGWRVELHAWEGTLSKAWLREFGEHERFRVHTLDRFAADLVDQPETDSERERGSTSGSGSGSGGGGGAKGL